jgi:hypothetical protein
MNRRELFELYKKVQNKDKRAEDLLINEHKRHFPRSNVNEATRGKCTEYRRWLHTMYIHLDRKLK